MMPPPPDTSGTAAADSVELTPQALAQLRTAGGWARFVAIVSFVATGIVGLASVAMLVAWSGHEIWTAGNAIYLVLLLLVLGVSGGAASLVWRYGQDAVAFSTHGAPAPARAFRSLRQVVILWTIVVALTAAWQLVTVVAKLF